MPSTVKIDEEYRRIMICGEIDEESSADILEAFLEMEKQTQDLSIVYLGSPGGSWEYGAGLLQLFLKSRCYITSYGCGNIASTSAMLFLAADERYLAPRSSLLFHYGSLELDDTYKEVINYTELAKKDIEYDHEFLSERSARPPAYWKEELEKGNFYIDTELALKLELINGIKLPSEE